MLLGHMLKTGKDVEKERICLRLLFFLPASAGTQLSVPSGSAIAGSSLNPLLHLQTSPLHSFSLPVHVVVGSHFDSGAGVGVGFASQGPTVDPLPEGQHLGQLLIGLSYVGF